MRPKNIDRVDERHLNLRLLPVLIGVFGVLYGLTGFRGWLVFFLGTAGLWLLAALWISFLVRGISIERRIHITWATVGDSLHEQIKVINKSWLPAIWLEITDASNTLEIPVRLVSDVAAHAARTRHLSHLCKRRGLYRLGPTRLRTGDPFGVYTLTLHDQHSNTILVTPPILPLSQLKIAPGGWAGDERRRRGAIERDISEAGVRNYIPGDSLRRINWRASAHFDTLMVRQLDAATSRDWWIYVDLDKAVQAGSGQDNTLELSILVAASLAMRGLKERRRVGLALAGPNLARLEPRADPAHRWRILRALALAEPGDLSFADLMTVGQPAKIATVILITPSPNPGWVAAAERRNRSGSLMALIIDPTNFGKPVDQGRVAAALARSRIPYTRIPRSLLEEAYSSLGPRRQKHTPGLEIGKRYLEQGRESWQSVD
jgi:uncharacterized protein (DUF58 family)